MSGTAPAENIEIERRFIVMLKEDFDVDGEANEQIAICQGYFTRSPPAVRIRRFDKLFYLTFKSGGGMVRTEIEVDVLDPVDGHGLLKMCEHKIEKTRYRFGRWELDVFLGPFEGLVILEIELSSEDEELPDFPAGVTVVREVTDDPEIYSNQALAFLDPAGIERLMRAAYTPPA